MTELSCYLLLDSFIKDPVQWESKVALISFLVDEHFEAKEESPILFANF